LLEEERRMREHIFKSKETLSAEFNVLRNQLEEAAEANIETLKEEYEVQLKKISEQMDKAESEKRSKKTIYEFEAQKLEEKKTTLKGILEDI